MWYFNNKFVTKNKFIFHQPALIFAVWIWAICAWKPKCRDGSSGCAWIRKSCRFGRLSSSAWCPSCFGCPPRYANCLGMEAWSLGCPSSSAELPRCTLPKFCSCLRPHARPPCLSELKRTNFSWMRTVLGIIYCLSCRRMVRPYIPRETPSHRSKIGCDYHGRSQSQCRALWGYLSYIGITSFLQERFTHDCVSDIFRVEVGLGHGCSE